MGATFTCDRTAVGWRYTIDERRAGWRLTLAWAKRAALRRLRTGR